MARPFDLHLLPPISLPGTVPSYHPLLFLLLKRPNVYINACRTEELHLQDNRMNKLCKVSAPFLEKDACSLHVQTNEARLLLCDRDRRRTRVGL
jgi:hypothetical protein